MLSYLELSSRIHEIFCYCSRGCMNTTYRAHFLGNHLVHLVKLRKEKVMGKRCEDGISVPLLNNKFTKYAKQERGK